MALNREVVELLLSGGANPKVSDNGWMTPLDHIEQVFEANEDRFRRLAEAQVGGLLGAGVILLLRHELNAERKRARPVVALLEQASRDWSLLDTLRDKLK